MPITKECPICKIDFKVKKSSFKRRVYCSKNCMKSGFSERMKGSNNNNYKERDKKKNICIVCNNEFTILKKLYSGGNKTCGDKCLRKFISSIHSGKTISENQRATISLRNSKPLNKSFFCVCGNTKSYKSVKCASCFYAEVSVYGNCKNCNKYFKKRSHVTSTCSRECYIELKTKQSTSENNPNWKGGVKTIHQRIRNHNVYKFWRDSVYKMDNYKCRDCGQIGGKLHAHHIKSFSKHPELRLDISNGKTVCIECHKKYHPSMNFSVKAKMPKTFVNI